MSAITTAASTPSAEPRANDDVIGGHVCTARYTCNDKNVVCLFHAQFRVYPLRPFGVVAAVVQIADINEGMFSHDYLS